MEAAVIIACLLFSAFFSGMEIAYVSANKVYLGVESQQKNFVSRILARLTNDPVEFITAMLIGNSLALVVYGYHAGKAVLALFGTGPGISSVWLLLLQVVITGMLILLTADFLPKVFFQVYANTLIKIFAIPAYLFYLLFYPVTRGVIAISDFLLKHVFRMREKGTRSYLSRGELGEFVNARPDAEEEEEETDAEIQIFRNAMVFSNRTARDIMTPRPEIASVGTDEALDELQQLFVDTGYSKIMVYSAEKDNIIGYVHSFDLFSKPATITDIMIPIETAHDTMLIKDLLNLLTRKHKSVAVIKDGAGATLGIITVEDIIEELFGEIEDEHDADHALELARKNGAYVFSAQLDVAYVNQKYSLALPEDEAYNSLAGMVVTHTGGIPARGTRVTIGGYSVRILKGSEKMIETIKIRPLLQGKNLT